MTGPEHYREAERLLSIQVSVERADQGAVIALRLAAQTHATLALAAAVAARIAKSYDGDDFREYAHAWSEAIS